LLVLCDTEAKILLVVLFRDELVDAAEVTELLLLLREAGVRRAGRELLEVVVVDEELGLEVGVEDGGASVMVVDRGGGIGFGFGVAEQKGEMALV
jgi:hypothetical protein